MHTKSLWRVLALLVFVALALAACQSGADEPEEVGGFQIPAIEEGKFDNEVTPVTIKTRKGDIEVTIDEQPGKARLDKIPTLRPEHVRVPGFFVDMHLSA